MAGKITEIALGLLRRWYKDGWQNGKTYPIDSMYTVGRGAGVGGLSFCQRRGWIVSEPDAKLDKRGWRHDITPAGRVAGIPQDPEVSP